MGKKKKAEKLIYDNNVVAIGQELVAEGTIPDFSTNGTFGVGYARNLLRTSDHLMTWLPRSDEYHPEHHLFIGHVLMNTGRIVYGSQFLDTTIENVPFGKTPQSVNFGDMSEHYQELLQGYASDPTHKSNVSLYERLRDGGKVHEQVSIVEKHVEQLRVGRARVQKLEQTMWEIATSNASDNSYQGRQYNAEEKRGAYLIAALINKIQATEHMRANGLTNLRVEPVKRVSQRKAKKKRK